MTRLCRDGESSETFAIPGEWWGDSGIAEGREGRSE